MIDNVGSAGKGEAYDDLASLPSLLRHRAITEIPETQTYPNPRVW
jgi:hypothetical protein